MNTRINISIYIHNINQYIPGVHSPRLGEGHRELGATLHLDHSQTRQGINLKGHGVTN